MATPVANADRALADGVKTVGGIITGPLDLTSHLIRQLRNVRHQVHTDIAKEMPSMKGTIVKVASLIKGFHIRVLAEGSRLSGNIENGVQSLLSKVFIPLSFCRVGEALRHFLSSKMAAVVGVLTFGAIQFFHALPYLVASSLITGTILLYQSSPVTLACFFAGGLLLIQVIQSYLTVKGIEIANEILDERLAIDNLASLLQVQELRKTAEDKVDAFTEELKKEFRKMSNKAINQLMQRVAHSTDLVIETLAEGLDGVNGRIDDFYRHNQGSKLWSVTMPPTRNPD